MSLDNYKITQNDIETKGVVAAPDVLSGGAQKNKAIFDRLIREAVAVQFNAMVDALTASSGAGEIGAAVDGIAAGTVLGVLSALKVLHDSTEQTQGATNESVQAALGNRYTKDQTDAMLQGKLDTVTANQMVRAIEFDAETGVFTVTTQGGAVSTIDTMLERVPASFTLESNQLVLTLEDGTRQTADLSAFIDAYTFSSGGTVEFSQNGKTVTAEVRDGSLALSKLTPEAQATLASYANRAEAAKESAETARAGAEAARDAAQRAAATAEEKASAAAGSASAAGNHASNAAGSAGAAKESETNAKDSETAAKEAQKAAEQARDEAQAVAGGDFIPSSQKGAAGGVASLGTDGKVPVEQLPAVGAGEMTAAVYDPQGKAQDVFAYADTKLPLAGGTMTGKLTMNSVPVETYHYGTLTWNDVKSKALGVAPTGVICITVPNFNMFVATEILLQGQESVAKYTLYFYTFTSGASAVGQAGVVEANNMPTQVRTGTRADGRRCWLIGDVDTVWKTYLSANITKMTMQPADSGTPNYNEVDISVVTDLSAYTIDSGTVPLTIMGAVNPDDLTDVVPIEKGGTGAASAADARTALGVPSTDEMNDAIAAIPTPDVSGQIETHNTSATAHSDIRAELASKAPSYTYGTTDLEAGVSPLATGTLYFVYE